MYTFTYSRARADEESSELFFQFSSQQRYFRCYYDPIIFNSLSFLLLRNSSTISFSVSPFVDSVLLPFIFVCLSLSIFLLRIVYLISIFSSLHFYSLYGEREMLLFSYSFYFLSFLLRRWWGGYSNLSKFQS